MSEKRAGDGSNAFSLALWLRDLGSSRERIADVLGIRAGAVDSVLSAAGSRGAHPAKSVNGRADVAVFLDNGDDRLVDQAAALARRRGAKLHLIARHRRIRPGLFGVSEARMRKGAEFRLLAEQRLVDAARLAIHRGIDVVPHAVAEDEADALNEVTRLHGAVALVVDHRRQPAVEEAGRDLGAELVDVGSPVNEHRPIRRLTPAFR